MKILIVFLFAWLLLSAVGYGIGFYVFDPGHLDHMAKNGEGVWGRVTSKEPENHATVRYSYVVNDKEYVGAGHAGDENPEFDKIQIGDRVVVYYDPDNPAESILGNPWDDLGAQNTGILFLTIVFPIIPMLLILGIYFGIRIAKKNTSG
jgi:hypothetical protein